MSIIDTLASTYADEMAYIDALFQKEGIEFNPEELLIDIDNAWRAIASYLWIDSKIYDEKFSTLVIRLAMTYFKNNQINKAKLKGEVDATQITQGSRSITYASKTIAIDDYGLTADIRAALPPRKLKVV